MIFQRGSESRQELTDWLSSLATLNAKDYYLNFVEHCGPHLIATQ